MRVFNLPPKISAVIFDIDGTLYSSPQFVKEQVDAQIRHWASLTGQTAEEAREKIRKFRNKFARENGGKKISLGNTFLNFGISIETSIQWRNELLHPENFLSPDERLKSALSELKKKCALICLTNNPVEAARKTLAQVGIEKIIPQIIGLDTCKKSKPSMEMLDLACERLGVPPKECVSVGDRYDIDLALPLEIGMGGILVDGATELHEINSVLEGRLSS